MMKLATFVAVISTVSAVKMLDGDGDGTPPRRGVQRKFDDCNSPPAKSNAMDEDNADSPSTPDRRTRHRNEQKQSSAASSAPCTPLRQQAAFKKTVLGMCTPSPKGPQKGLFPGGRFRDNQSPISARSDRSSPLIADLLASPGTEHDAIIRRRLRFYPNVPLLPGQGSSSSAAASSSSGSAAPVVPLFPTYGGAHSWQLPVPPVPTHSSSGFAAASSSSSSAAAAGSSAAPMPAGDMTAAQANLQLAMTVPIADFDMDLETDEERAAREERERREDELIESMKNLMPNKRSRRG